jgi:hypothetical protein
MKDKTIDYILRTWQTVSRMYNEEAKYRPQWQLVLLYEHGQKYRNLYIIGTKWEWRLPVLPEPKINGRERLNHPKEKSR